MLFTTNYVPDVGDPKESMMQQPMTRSSGSVYTPLRAWCGTGHTGTPASGLTVERLSQLLGPLFQRMAAQISIRASVVLPSHFPVSLLVSVPTDALWRLSCLGSAVAFNLISLLPIPPSAHSLGSERSFSSADLSLSLPHFINKHFLLHPLSRPKLAAVKVGRDLKSGR